MRITSLLALLRLACCSALDPAQPRPPPPGPPATGAGSVDLPARRAYVSRNQRFPRRFHALRAGDPHPRARRSSSCRPAPQAVDTRDLTDAQLRHLARRGPSWSMPRRAASTSPATQDAARRAIGSALDELARPGHVRPDGRFGIIGLSVGGLVALTLAANPGDCRDRRSWSRMTPPAWTTRRSPASTRTRPDPRGIDPASRLLVIESATTAGTPNARGRHDLAQHLDAARARNWLRVPSDGHGTPPLVSDHLGSLAGEIFLSAGSPLDAIDWWGYWRRTDAALAQGFGETADGFAFCSDTGPLCDPVRDMGSWSDGTPVAASPTPPTWAGEAGSAGTTSDRIEAGRVNMCANQTSGARTMTETAARAPAPREK